MEQNTFDSLSEQEKQVLKDLFEFENKKVKELNQEEILKIFRPKKNAYLTSQLKKGR